MKGGAVFGSWAGDSDWGPPEKTTFIFAFCSQFSARMEKRPCPENPLPDHRLRPFYEVHSSRFLAIRAISLQILPTKQIRARFAVHHGPRKSSGRKRSPYRAYFGRGKMSSLDGRAPGDRGGGNPGHTLPSPRSPSETPHTIRTRMHHTSTVSRKTDTVSPKFVIFHVGDA